MWQISLTTEERPPQKLTAPRHALETLHIFVEAHGNYNFIFGTVSCTTGIPLPLPADMRYAQNPPFLYTRVLQSYLAQYLVPGLVPPLISTVGINGKVSFIEKYGTSEFKNSTGAYELDLSLVDDFEHAWRVMHVKTDPWCSAAIV